MDNKTVILNKFERPTMRIEGRFFLWCYRPEKPIESYKVIILQPALLIFVILVVFLYRHIIYL